jgi:hypothetical protein
MNEIYNQYKEDMEFFFIYTREAHPTDGWQVDANVEQGILFRQHQSTEEREEAAGSCTVGLQIQLPTLIEGIDNGIDDAYGAAPVRQYVIGKDGVVTYHGGAGPHFLDLYDWAEAIKSTIS